MFRSKRDKYDDFVGSSSKGSMKLEHDFVERNNSSIKRKVHVDTVTEDSDSDSDSDFEPSKKRFRSSDDKLKSQPQSSSRRIWQYDELDKETRKAKSAEKQSILQRKEKEIFLASQLDSASTELVLDIDPTTNKKILVHNQVSKLLKPHQIDGIKHMFECCYGSVLGKGSGCILAHCMGLGKTLQLIALLHTVINHPVLATNRILILCPKTTTSNWRAEIGKWIGSIKKTRRLQVFEFSDSCAKDQQLDKLRIWSRYTEKSENAGCFLMTYESFRSLVFYGEQKSKNVKNPGKVSRVRDTVQRCLLEATDLVVCDEGHNIKNLVSSTSQAVAKLRTLRRIVLTGTPMQNNLMEYHAMVNFVKPSFLGTAKEFKNIYANPIAKGQHKDSTPEQIRLMRMQSFNLNRELESFVHRREVSFLEKELPEKLDYVLYIPMSEIQTNLYEYYLEENPYVSPKTFFADYTAMRKIWTHPKFLQIGYEKAVKKDASTATNQKSKSIDFEGEFNNESVSVDKNATSVSHDWWRQFVTDDDLNSILPSPKFEIMLEILEECRQRSEKCLIFSSSVVCIDVIEYFLKNNLSWKKDRDYFRLDGNTNNFQRNRMIVEFNKPENQRVKVFLISSKAGGQGINLTAANRIILLDTEWNPSIDQQSIFRIFRFGQQKKCYIYRLLSMGTMEEKIYSRSVTKQAMSYRVLDKQQIDRNYNMTNTKDLYVFDKPDMNEREIPIQPKDEVLGHLLNKFPDKVYKYHEHQSLLDNKHEQELTEEEKQEAFRRHRNMKNRTATETSSTVTTEAELIPTSTVTDHKQQLPQRPQNDVQPYEYLNWPQPLYGNFQPSAAYHNSFMQTVLGTTSNSSMTPMSFTYAPQPSSGNPGQLGADNNFLLGPNLNFPPMFNWGTTESKNNVMNVNQSEEQPSWDGLNEPPPKRIKFGLFRPFEE